MQSFDKGAEVQTAHTCAFAVIRRLTVVGDEDHIQSPAKGNTFGLPVRQLARDRRDKLPVHLFKTKQPYLSLLDQSSRSHEVRNSTFDSSGNLVVDGGGDSASARKDLWQQVLSADLRQPR